MSSVVRLASSFERSHFGESLVIPAIWRMLPRIGVWIARMGGGGWDGDLLRSWCAEFLAENSGFVSGNPLGGYVCLGGLGVDSEIFLDLRQAAFESRVFVFWIFGYLCGDIGLVSSPVSYGQ